MASLARSSNRRAWLALTSSTASLPSAAVAARPKAGCSSPSRWGCASHYNAGSRRRWFSANAVSDKSNGVQIYVSHTNDPFINLSIEHFLLENSHPDSVILFLYTNRPCVVIGRNQNPFMEVNLGMLSEVSRLPAKPFVEEPPGEASKKGDDLPLLVRRRSGGGTVFHDFGNTNFSVINNPSHFDRNKHAAMVARALNRLNVFGNPRVNKRHDIVIDDPESDTAVEGGGSFKISGSAYKLTRLRSLHHGTCLLNSPNLPKIGDHLRSALTSFIKSRGADSVRSPIRNVGISTQTPGYPSSSNPLSAFDAAVINEFQDMYRPRRHRNSRGPNNSDVDSGGHGTIAVKAPPRSELSTMDKDGFIDVALPPPDSYTIITAEDALAAHRDIARGVAELRSASWIWGQTPQFTFSTCPTAEDPRPRPTVPRGSEKEWAIPRDLTMTVRHGQIISISSGSPRLLESVEAVAGELNEYEGLDCKGLEGKYLHEIEDWGEYFDVKRGGPRAKKCGASMNALFGMGKDNNNDGGNLGFWGDTALTVGLWSLIDMFSPF